MVGKFTVHYMDPMGNGRLTIPRYKNDPSTNSAYGTRTHQQSCNFQHVCVVDGEMHVT